MIRFDCPGCGKSISVEDDAAGRKGACPVCGETVQVPPPAAEGSRAEPSSADTPVPAEIVPDAPFPAVPVSQSTGKGGAGIVLIVIAVVAAVVLLAVVGLSTHTQVFACNTVLDIAGGEVDAVTSPDL